MTSLDDALRLRRRPLGHARHPCHDVGIGRIQRLADHDFEIVADRGIDARVGHDGWERICQQMETDFRAGDFERGVVKGVEAVSRELATHFPRSGGGPNELPDKPVVM